MFMYIQPCFIIMDFVWNFIVVQMKNTSFAICIKMKMTQQLLEVLGSLGRKYLEVQQVRK